MARNIILAQNNPEAVLVFVREGIIYSISSDKNKDCKGCTFEHDSNGCSNIPGSCSAMYRGDGQSVIWIKESS